MPALDFSTLTDTEVHDLVSGIGNAAPNCSIIKNNAPLTACVAALATKDTALTTSVATVATTRSKLQNDLGNEAQDRSDLHGELRTYVSLFTNLAKSPADLLTGGLSPAPARPPKNQPPDVPQQLDNKPPKKGHGKTVVSVHETGTVRHQYVAQQSLDGTNWTQLGTSHGKTRTVTGATGTKVWVRFAMVRANLQSDWSVPILVTIP